MSRKLKIPLISVLIVIGLTLSFAAGCTIDFLKPTTTSVNQTQAQTQNLDIDLVNAGFDIIKTKYVEPNKINGQTLTEGAIKGMVDALNDPHSAYLTKAQFEVTQSDIGGRFDGIGAYVGMENGIISIIAPIPGTPAEKAGIKPGDLILEINGKSTEGMNTFDATQLIRGPKGTPVKLTVLHKGSTSPVTLEIVRAEIKVPSVVFEMKGTIADINITNFSESTNTELVPVLQTIAKNGATGIILDLRSDPGGLLDVCIQVASHFISDGVVVSVVDRDGNKETSNVVNTSVKTKLPMVVLVNQYSASASEVLTGALKDHQRAVIAGTVTYGKGSVNNLVPLPDGSGIYITIGRWLTPNGNLIEGKGIQPDQTVDFTKVDGIQWAIDYLNSHK